MLRKIVLIVLAMTCFVSAQERGDFTSVRTNGNEYVFEVIAQDTVLSRFLYNYSEQSLQYKLTDPDGDNDSVGVKIIAYASNFVTDSASFQPVVTVVASETDTGWSPPIAVYKPFTRYLKYMVIGLAVNDTAQLRLYDSGWSNQPGMDKILR